MATLLTFGNPLKFGRDSCHNARGRPTFLHRERALKALREQQAYISKGALQRGPALAGAVATVGGRTKVRWQRFFAPDRGQALTCIIFKECQQY